MIDLSVNIGYNDLAKKQFKTTSVQFLKSLAKKLNLITHDISYNKAGVASSGEISLKGTYDNGNSVYVHISTPSNYGILFRTIENFNDHLGGLNQWIRPNGSMSVSDIADIIKKGTYV